MLGPVARRGIWPKAGTLIWHYKPGPRGVTIRAEGIRLYLT